MNMDIENSIKEILDKYSPKEKNEEMYDELSVYLRENQDTLLKIIKLDEFPLTDLGKQAFVKSIELTNNPLEINDLFEDFMINKVFNLNLDKKEEAENSPCFIMYYDIQRMHCISCGKESFYKLTEQAIERLNIKENEIIFFVVNNLENNN